MNNLNNNINNQMNNQLTNYNFNLSKKVAFPVLCFVVAMNASCSSNAQLTSSETRVVPNSSYYYGKGQSTLTISETRQKGNASNYGTRSNYHSNNYFNDTYSSWEEHSSEDLHHHDYSNNEGNLPDFDTWLSQHRYYKSQVDDYQKYLVEQLGSSNVPPMAQLVRTARSWDTCGAEPYQVPPRYLWSNIVPTLRLYNNLKRQGIVPNEAIIRSVYRDYSLNRCAGGASSSKHLENAAIDIWVPSYEYSSWQQDNLKDQLCTFWKYQGQMYNFGLGIYSTGAIHLDTQKYRKWGAQFTPSYSSCRY